MGAMEAGPAMQQQQLLVTQGRICQRWATSRCRVHLAALQAFHKLSKIQTSSSSHSSMLHPFHSSDASSNRAKKVSAPRGQRRADQLALALALALALGTGTGAWTKRVRPWDTLYFIIC